MLSDYAARFGADARTWRFLTGERAAIWSLCNDGFKLPVEEDAKDDPARLIFHSAKLVLVDRQGQIRDYFTGVNAPPEERARLLEAIDALLEEPAPPG